MQFTTAAIIAFATMAVALPEASQSMAKLSNSAAFRVQAEKAASQCDVGSISCCNNAKETENSSLLSGLLEEGVLNGLLGTSGSACARTSLIDQLGLLALTEHTETGPVCKNIIACCPEGATTCVAVDNAEGAGSEGKN